MISSHYLSVSNGCRDSLIVDRWYVVTTVYSAQYGGRGGVELWNSGGARAARCAPRYAHVHSSQGNRKRISTEAILALEPAPFIAILVAYKQ
jgi:hypothetical protein